MAIVNSLVCFGGRAGLTVTMSSASPCVVTLTNHGLRDGTGVVFSTTGALYTGLVAGTTYYSHSTGANTFNVYDTAAHAIAGGSTGLINTSGSQSGTHTIKGAYFSGLTASQLARYGSAGSERIYSGLGAWNTARAAATKGKYDTEVCEIGEAFTDACTGEISLEWAVASTIIHSYVDGVRSSAFHGGVTGAGYIYKSTINYVDMLVIRSLNVIFDGITIDLGAETHDVVGILNDYNYNASKYIIRNNILYCSSNSTTYTAIGIRTGCIAAEIYDNIIHGIAGSNSVGMHVRQYSNDLTKIYGNLVTKCATGMQGDTQECKGYVFNNISVGNTTNWGTQPNQLQDGNYNAGLSANTKWHIDPETSITIATTDFADYTNNNFAPAAATSPQVRSGLVVYGGDPYDMLGKPRQAYMNVTHRFNYDTEASGPFQQWEVLSWGTGGTAGTGVLMALTDNGSTGSLDIHLLSGVAPTDNATITGGTSSATCAVNGTVAEVDGEWVPSNTWSVGPIEYDYGGPSSFQTLTIGPVDEETEIRIMEHGTTTEITGIEQVGETGYFSYEYPYSGESTLVDINILHIAYENEFYSGIELGDSNISLFVKQRPDRNYLNPS